MWWYWVYDNELIALTRKPQDVWEGETFKIDWDPSYFETLSVVCSIGLVLTFARFFCVRYFLNPLGRRYVLDAGFSFDHVVKFCESGWRFLFYSASTALLFYCVWSKEWFWKPWLVWELGNNMEFDTYWIYMIELGWYSHSILTHIFIDDRKKDFVVMCIHHFVTWALLFMSFQCGFFRIGLIVLFLS